MSNINLSVLDLVTAFNGQSARDAMDRAAAVAAGVEKLGWIRYLVAEHHNMPSTLSSATSVVIQRILSKTDRIQVGAGGVMLPNHSPLQVAEVYGTLDALYPGRVDLGIGRAPGTDPAAASLLIRKTYADSADFAHDVALIMHFFGPQEQQKVVGAYPGAGAEVHPIILGSSYSSAHVAAALGLPYAFAAHFSPHDVKPAAEIYRSEFKPSKYLSEPYFIVSVWLYASDTAEEAEEMYETGGKLFLKAIHGREESGEPLTSAEKILLSQTMGRVLKGDRQQIAEQWEQLHAELHPNELMAASASPDAQKLIRSFTVLNEAVRS